MKMFSRNVLSHMTTAGQMKTRIRIHESAIRPAPTERRTQPRVPTLGHMQALTTAL